MAKLINGDGNKAIWAAQDADLIAALAGDVTGIAKVGNKYAATQEDANTIGLADGVIVTKEGRRIQLDTGNVDLFDIPTGTAGTTNYYIIGYHLFTNSDSSQECETFVQKMDNGTDVIAENTFKGGATEVYVSLYRITQLGLNISSIDALLSELDNISALMSDLSKKAEYTLLWENENPTSAMALNAEITLSSSNYDFLLFVFDINVSYSGTYITRLEPKDSAYFQLDNATLTNSGIDIRARVFAKTSNTKLTCQFSRHYPPGGSVTNETNSIVPIKIYGLKI